MRRCFLICDDRPAAEIGVRLAVASLRRYASGEAVRVVFPPADRRLRGWLGCEELTRIWPAPHGGWDVKPVAIHAALEEFEQVVWLDSDVICAADPRPTLTADASTLVVGEEPHNGTVAGGGRGRCLDWGWPVGRDLPAVNSGTLVAGRRHRPLLQAWASALDDPRYRDNQTRHRRDRDLGCVGDQDVLSALLARERFAGVPVRLLRSGIDVVQNLGAFGWHPRHRLRALARGSPPLVHALGPKPWDFADTLPHDAPPQVRHDAAVAEVSVYTQVARRLADAAGLSAQQRRWMWPRTARGRLLRLAGLGVPALLGLPLAAGRLLR